MSTRLGPFVTEDQLTLDHRVALAHLTETIEALRAEAAAGRAANRAGQLLYTEANNMALILSAEGTPYRLGGIDPFHGGADCSGLFYWAALQCVDANGRQVVLPRTTSAEWNGLPHNPNWQACPIGQPIEFEVPSDGPPIPQHVALNVGGGFMVDDPHTGAVVRREAIPNEPGVIWPIGFVTLPFVITPPTPAPQPSPPTQIFKPLTGRFGVLNKPAVAVVRRPQNDGYWLVAADGGTFNYGKAAFLGSLGSLKLNAPIIDAACTPSGAGLVLVATDGGVFNFGDSNFYGSMGGKALNAPIVSIEMTESGAGYLMIGADGGVFPFGDAQFLGSPA